MAIVLKPDKHRILAKQQVRQLADEMNRRIGFTPDPTVTAEQAQESLRLAGIVPEDNEFSSEIIRRREHNHVNSQEK